MHTQSVSDNYQVLTDSFYLQYKCCVAQIRKNFLPLRFTHWSLCTFAFRNKLQSFWHWNPDSVIGVATRYELEDSGFEPRWDNKFFSSPHPSRAALQPTMRTTQSIAEIKMDTAISIRRLCASVTRNRVDFLNFFSDATQARSASFLRFLNHTQWHTTVGRSHLDEWSTRSRNFYLTINNAHKRQTSRPPAGFESAIPASDRPQTLALDRSDTGIGYRVSFIRTFVVRLLGRRSSDRGTYRGHHKYRNWYAQNKHVRPRGRVRCNPLSSVSAYNLTSCTAGVISAFYL